MKGNIQISRLLETAARWYVFAMMMVYGLGKILGWQFYHRGHLPAEVAGKQVADLSAFELAWTFFGYSYTYIIFIGLWQVMGATMLLWERSKLLGVAILIPILANIILVDAVYGVKGAIMSAIFYFILLIFITLYNWPKVVATFKVLTGAPAESTPQQGSKLLRICIGFGILVILFFAETFFLKMDGFSRI